MLYNLRRGNTGTTSFQKTGITLFTYLDSFIIRGSQQGLAICGEIHTSHCSCVCLEHSGLSLPVTIQSDYNGPQLLPGISADLQFQKSDFTSGHFPNGAMGNFIIYAECSSVRNMHFAIFMSQNVVSTAIQKPCRAINEGD